MIGTIFTVPPWDPAGRKDIGSIPPSQAITPFQQDLSMQFIGSYDRWTGRGVRVWALIFTDRTNIHLDWFWFHNTT